MLDQQNISEGGNHNLHLLPTFDSASFFVFHDTDRLMQTLPLREILLHLLSHHTEKARI